MGMISSLLGRWIAHAIVAIDKAHGSRVDKLELGITYHDKYGKWPDYMSEEDIQKAIKYEQKKKQRNNFKWR